jgi:phosphoribosylformylglycinamidine (FGAM) synthase PurS component
MGGSSIELAIELVIPDNTAFTTLRALQALGYPELEQVQRADSLGLTIGPAAPEAPEVVRAVSRAEVIFNPNKHRLSYAADEQRSTADAGACEALVRDLDPEDERLRKLLATTFVMPYLQAVRRGVLWRLSERGGRPASAERTRWACESLLANAVSQRYQVRPRVQHTLFREQLAGTANPRA